MHSTLEGTYRHKHPCHYRSADNRASPETAITQPMHTIPKRVSLLACRMLGCVLRLWCIHTCFIWFIMHFSSHMRPFPMCASSSHPHHASLLVVSVARCTRYAVMYCYCCYRRSVVASSWLILLVAYYILATTYTGCYLSSSWLLTVSFFVCAFLLRQLGLLVRQHSHASIS
jgi:hypothetical protein